MYKIQYYHNNYSTLRKVNKVNNNHEQYKANEDMQGIIVLLGTHLLILKAVYY